MQPILAQRALIRRHNAHAGAIHPTDFRKRAFRRNAIGHDPINPHLTKTSGVQRRPVVPRRCIRNHGGPSVFRMTFGRRSLTCRALLLCRQRRIAVNTVTLRSLIAQTRCGSGRQRPDDRRGPPPIRAGIRLMKALEGVKTQIRRKPRLRMQRTMLHFLPVPCMVFTMQTGPPPCCCRPIDLQRIRIGPPGRCAHRFFQGANRLCNKRRIPRWHPERRPAGNCGWALSLLGR